MYFQRLGKRYSFVYFDPVLKKNVRLKQCQTPEIQTDEEARAFCVKWDRKLDAMKTRIEERLKWEEKYYSFQALFDQFIQIRREEAPNSVSADHYSMRYFILPFFVGEKRLNNVELWPDHFEEFRDFLLGAPRVKQSAGKSSIAFSTKNGVIRSLNAFMLMCTRRKLLGRLEKCRYFEKHKVRRRGEGSVIPSTHQFAIFRHLFHEMSDEECSEFFWVACHTGLRFSEQLGLSLSDLFTAEYQDKTLLNALKPYALKPLGYLSIDSQVAHPNRPISKEGVVHRKPLKSKRLICHANARLVPIFDRQCFNILAKRRNKALVSFQKKAGQDPKNFLLWTETNKNTYSNCLRKAQKELRHTTFWTPHDCRHTYATWLARQSAGSFTLCQMILGHASIDVTQHYVHIAAEMQKNLRTTLSLQMPIELVNEQDPQDPQKSGTND